MFRKAISFGGLLLLAGAAVLVTAGSTQARGGGHGGGGHGGGGHGGGFHAGGHGGGFHAGGGGFHASTFHGSGFHGGGFHGSAFRGGGFPHGDFNRGIHAFRNGDFRHGDFRHGDFRDFHRGGLWGYPGYYGDYGAWPYNYGAYPYDGYSDDSLYSSDSPAYDSGYDGAEVTSSDPDTDDASQADTNAVVTVNAPADAEIWFDDTKMATTGSVREYETPPLNPGSPYSYDLRARWTENGHEVNQTQHVKVTAGAHVKVQFPKPTTPAVAPSR